MLLLLYTVNSNIMSIILSNDNDRDSDLQTIRFESINRESVNPENFNNENSIIQKPLITPDNSWRDRSSLSWLFNRSTTVTNDTPNNTPNSKSAEPVDFSQCCFLCVFLYC